MTALGWLVPWEPSVVVVTLTLAAAIFYSRGAHKIVSPLSHKISFWAGLASMYAVSQTHFDFYAEHEFFIHRFQHTVLHHIGPFLIALARPGETLSAGAGHRLMKRIRNFLNDPAIAAPIDFLNRPAVAAAVFVGLIIFWLIPPIHFVAMLDWFWYRVMNWSMALNGLMFWNLVLNSYALRPASLSAGTRILIMLAVIPPQIMVGVLIFVARYEVFLSYGVCGRAFAALSPIEDQQIGGLILWIPAAMMSIAGILIVMRRDWLHRE